MVSAAVKRKLKVVNNYRIQVKRAKEMYLSNSNRQLGLLPNELLLYIVHFLKSKDIVSIFKLHELYKNYHVVTLSYRNQVP